MTRIKVYPKSYCPSWNEAKMLLKSKGLSEEIDTSDDEARERQW